LENWTKNRGIRSSSPVLESCKACRLGPVTLTYDSVVGELQRGLWGYLYVKCSNIECAEINIVPYGKTHRTPGSKGILSFAVNTKLGTGNFFLYLEIKIECNIDCVVHLNRIAFILISSTFVVY